MEKDDHRERWSCGFLLRLRTAVEFFLLGQHAVHVGHPVADGDLLRALGLALIAVDAGAGARFFRNVMTINENGFAPILKHGTLVEDIEVRRDIHSVRARHAVLALRAGDGLQTLKGFTHVADSLFFHFGK